MYVCMYVRMYVSSTGCLGGVSGGYVLDAGHSFLGPLICHSCGCLRDVLDSLPEGLLVCALKSLDRSRCGFVCGVTLIKLRAKLISISLSVKL